MARLFEIAKKRIKATGHFNLRQRTAGEKLFHLVCPKADHNRYALNATRGQRPELNFQSRPTAINR